MEEAKYEKLPQEEEEETEEKEQEIDKIIADEENGSPQNDNKGEVENGKTRIVEIKFQTIGLTEKKLMLR